MAPSDFSPIIERINKLLHSSSYKLEFQPREEIAERGEWQAVELEAVTALAQEMTGPMFILSSKRSAYGFPVSVRGSFAGLAVIEDSAQRNQELDEKLLRLAELFTALLETKLRFAIDRDAVSRAEEKIAIMQEDTNIVEMRSTRLERVRDSLANLADFENAEAKHASETAMAAPTLIETGVPALGRKIAVDLHERTGRWAMLSLRDLPSGILGRRDELKELGAITLFIENLGALPQAEQELLASYLAIQPSAEMPQVVAVAASVANITKNLLGHFQRMSGDFSRYEKAPKLLARETEPQATWTEGPARVLDFHLH